MTPQIIHISRAVLCPDCSCISDVRGESCPCGSRSLMNMGRVLDRQVPCGSTEGRAAIGQIVPMHGRAILGVRESYPANSASGSGYRVPPAGIRNEVR